MNLATSRKLYFASLGVLVIGIVFYYITEANFSLARTIFDSFGFLHYFDSYNGATAIFKLAATVSVLLLAIAYVGALVKVARLKQWIWVGVLAIFTAAPITMLIYVLAGPTTPATWRVREILYPRTEQIPPDALKGGVFISYRREDSADICGRIYDHLSARYGKLQVFKYVDNIPYGADFPT